MVVRDWAGPELPPAVASVAVMPAVAAMAAMTSVASMSSMTVSAMTSVCGGGTYRGTGDAAYDGCFRGGAGSVEGKRESGACGD